MACGTVGTHTHTHPPLHRGGRYYATSLVAPASWTRVILNTLIPFKDQCPWVGDVRGMGLFRGIELLIDNQASDPQPHPMLAKYVVDFLRSNKRILISRDGPDENVLKIKPPLVFSKQNALRLVQGIQHALETAKSGNMLMSK